jgi:hypothetical protein
VGASHINHTLQSGIPPIGAITAVTTSIPADSDCHIDGVLLGQQSFEKMFNQTLDATPALATTEARISCSNDALTC